MISASLFSLLLFRKIMNWFDLTIKNWNIYQVACSSTD